MSFREVDVRPMFRMPTSAAQVAAAGARAAAAARVVAASAVAASSTEQTHAAEAIVAAAKGQKVERESCSTLHRIC